MAARRKSRVFRCAEEDSGLRYGAGVPVQVECSGLLFDMDGVLISSIASVNRSWVRWARQYGLPEPENVQIRHGVRGMELIQGFRPDLTAEEQVAALRVIEDFEIGDTDGLRVLDGVRELLGRLPAERWTIVTSATRRLLLGRLKAAELPFPNEIITADDVVKGKPDPEPYRKGAELLGFAPAACVVVEDAPSGVGAGVAAGSRVLGVLGTHSAAELYGAGAEWVVRSLAGVQAVVDQDGLRLEFEVAGRE